jgi:hypothetical protein
MLPERLTMCFERRVPESEVRFIHLYLHTDYNLH